MKLRRENRTLAMENEILKRAAAYFATGEKRGQAEGVRFKRAQRGIAERSRSACHSRPEVVVQDRDAFRLEPLAPKAPGLEHTAP